MADIGRNSVPLASATSYITKELEEYLRDEKIFELWRDAKHTSADTNEFGIEFAIKVQWKRQSYLRELHFIQRKKAERIVQILDRVRAVLEKPVTAEFQIRLREGAKSAITIVQEQEKRLFQELSEKYVRELRVLVTTEKSKKKKNLSELTIQDVLELERVHKEQYSQLLTSEPIPATVWTMSPSFNEHAPVFVGNVQRFTRVRSEVEKSKKSKSLVTQNRTTGRNSRKKRGGTEEKESDFPVEQPRKRRKKRVTSNGQDDVVVVSLDEDDHGGESSRRFNADSIRAPLHDSRATGHNLNEDSEDSNRARWSPPHMASTVETATFGSNVPLSIYNSESFESSNYFAGEDPSPRSSSVPIELRVRPDNIIADRMRNEEVHTNPRIGNSSPATSSPSSSSSSSSSASLSSNNKSPDGNYAMSRFFKEIFAYDDNSTVDDLLNSIWRADIEETEVEKKNSEQ